MKYLVAALLSWTGALAAPPPPPAPPPAQPAMGLRQAVEQYHPGGGASPRQLSPEERAELRRQLSEFKRAANPVRPAAAYEGERAERRR